MNDYVKRLKKIASYLATEEEEVKCRKTKLENWEQLAMMALACVIARDDRRIQRPLHNTWIFKNFMAFTLKQKRFHLQGECRDYTRTRTFLAFDHMTKVHYCSAVSFSFLATIFTFDSRCEHWKWEFSNLPFISRYFCAAHSVLTLKT